MQKFDLEALHWRSSTDRQSTWPRVIFGLFGDIFTLNADYIAWKLLKMALEVEYMMDFYHPGLLVTDLHLRSSTDRQSTWPRVIFGLFGDIFTLNADYIAWKLLKMALEVEYMMDFYHPGLLVTDLHLRSSTDRQSTWPRVIYGKFGDIFTLNADYIASKLLKMALEVEYMMEYQHPGLPVTDLHLRSSTDRQSTWSRVIFGPLFVCLFVNKITQKLTMDFDKFFRICPKW